MTIGIDVVGGLQKIVENWIEADKELLEAGNRYDQAREDCDRARSKKENAAKLLTERVGENVPMKVFRIDGGDVVIVEHGRAVRRVAVEQPDGR